jgi:putative endonuclease
MEREGISGGENRPEGGVAGLEAQTEPVNQRAGAKRLPSLQLTGAERSEFREAPVIRRGTTGAQRESREAPGVRHGATGGQAESREAPAVRRGTTGAQRESREAPGVRRGATGARRRESREAPGARRGTTGRRTYQQRIGQLAEDIAAEFLRARGLQILERNYRRRLGEIDIIARDGDVLIIAEVRTRASNRYGGAAASVDGRKQQRLVRAAGQLLQQRKDFAHLRARFDVLVVSEIGAASPKVDWLQHAFLT